MSMSYDSVGRLFTIPEAEKRALDDLEDILHQPIHLFTSDSRTMLRRSFHDLKDEFFCGDSYGETSEIFSGYGTVIQGHVVSLNLSHGNLTTLPPSIAQFTQLWRLGLVHNAFTTLPEELASLTELQVLDLSYNAFTDFPNVVTQIPSLIQLIFNNNSLETISRSINRLVNLELLGASHNKITYLPDPFGPLPQLQWLWLIDNLLKVLPKFVPSFSDRAMFIELSNNRLHDLPESMKYIETRFLQLQDNEFTVLPSVLRNMKVMEIGINRNPLQPPYNYIINRLNRSDVPNQNKTVNIAYIKHMIAYWDEFPDNLLALLRENRLPSQQFHQLILHSAVGGFVLQKCTEIDTPAARQYAEMILNEYHRISFDNYDLYGPI